MKTALNARLHQKARIHYLDWLRVLAVLGVFYAHSIFVFDMFYWHIQEREQNNNLTVLVVLGTQWGMSLFFLLAGAGAWFTLATKTPAQFVIERFKRLLMPFLVGFLLLSPPLAYLVAIRHALYKGTLWQFYASFFSAISVNWNPQWIGVYTFHLWFLAYLFCISTLALPILLYVKQKSSSDALARLAAFCDRPGGLLGFVLPIVLIQIALQARFPGYQSWSDIFTWLLLFLYGFLFFIEPHFALVIRKQWKLPLLMAITSFLILLTAFFAGVLSRWDALSDYSIGYILYQVLRSMFTWSWLLVTLYFGMRCLDFTNTFIEYAHEAVLPFYILHYPIIVVLTFLSLSWNIPLSTKFLLVSTLALLATIVVFDLCIRRITIMRWLFGMTLVYEHQQDARSRPPLHSASL